MRTPIRDAEEWAVRKAVEEANQEVGAGFELVSAPLNADPEIQTDIDLTIAQMRKVEANYLAEINHLRAWAARDAEDSAARDRIVSRLWNECLSVRRPYVERVQELAASSRRDGVTYLEPLSQELAARIGQAVRPAPNPKSPREQAAAFTLNGGDRLWAMKYAVDAVTAKTEKP